jgi:hypothetical protein
MPIASVWDGKVEEDILSCLEEAYNNANFKEVYNWHRIDRAHEESVDIECKNNNYRQILQAKIKPGKNDIEQLFKLSKTNADRRIYVYVQKPSAAFKAEMDHLSGEIEFLNIDGLHNLLVKYRSILYLRFLLLDSNLTKDLKETLLKIVSCRKILTSQLQFGDLENWWLFKDRAVKVHAAMEYLYNFWHDTLFKADKHDEDTYRRIIENVLFSFEITSNYCSNDLKEIVHEIKTTHPNVLSEYMAVVLGRSNWINMMPLKWDNFDEKKTIDLIENFLIPPPKGFSEYLELNDYLYNLNDVSEAIEDGVDWLYEDFLKNHKVSSGKVGFN